MIEPLPLLAGRDQRTWTVPAAILAWTERGADGPGAALASPGATTTAASSVAAARPTSDAAPPARDRDRDPSTFSRVVTTSAGVTATSLWYHSAAG